MKEELQRDYQTLRELLLLDIKRGNFPGGLAKSFKNLKLTKKEIYDIISSWIYLNKIVEIKFYKNALLKGDYEEICLMDTIYLDMLEAEKEAQVEQKRG